MNNKIYIARKDWPKKFEPGPDGTMDVFGDVGGVRMPLNINRTIYEWLDKKVMRWATGNDDDMFHLPYMDGIRGTNGEINVWA